MVSTILALVATVTGYGKETVWKRRSYFGAAILAILIGTGSGYNVWRPWNFFDAQTERLEASACQHNERFKFPFYVFDIGDPESNTLAVRIVALFEKCGWAGVSLFPNDGWLRKDTRGIEIVWSPEPQNSDYRKAAKQLSDMFRGAEIDHVEGPHTRLEHTPTKMGIVVGGKPNLWEHVIQLWHAVNTYP